MTAEHDENLKRWTAKRRSALVLEILRGDTSVAEIEEWRDRSASW